MSALHASHHQRCVQSVLTCVALLGRVQLFPNWVVRYVRNPNLRLKSWMGVPVEVFIVPPAMSKFEIAEYLKRLYNLPILKVHTALSSPPRPLTAPPHPAAPHLIPPASRVLAPLARPLTRTPGPRFRAPDSHP